MFEIDDLLLAKDLSVVRDNLLEMVIKKLPNREAFVIRKMLLSNLTGACIARRLKVSRWRVYQIRDKAIRHMIKISKNMPEIFNEF